jgi:uncharacterized protein YeeX (DUF496 family)
MNIKELNNQEINDIIKTKHLISKSRGVFTIKPRALSSGENTDMDIQIDVGNKSKGKLVCVEMIISGPTNALMKCRIQNNNEHKVIPKEPFTNLIYSYSNTIKFSFSFGRKMSRQKILINKISYWVLGKQEMQDYIFSSLCDKSYNSIVTEMNENKPPDNNKITLLWTLYQIFSNHKQSGEILYDNDIPTEDLDFGDFVDESNIGDQYLHCLKLGSEYISSHKTFSDKVSIRDEKNKKVETINKEIKLLKNLTQYLQSEIEKVSKQIEYLNKCKTTTDDIMVIDDQLIDSTDIDKCKRELEYEKNKYLVQLLSKLSVIHK